jgi:hypothetical protein
MLPSRGARLKFQMNDLLQWIAKAQDQIGGLRDGGQIDIQQRHGSARRPIEGSQEAVRIGAAHVFERRIEGQGHRESLPGNWRIAPRTTIIRHT